MTISRELEQTFNVHALLVKPVQVTVAVADNDKRRITALAGIPKGMTVPPAHNEALYFSLDPSEFSEEALENVYDYWRD